MHAPGGVRNGQLPSEIKLAYLSSREKYRVKGSKATGSAFLPVFEWTKKGRGFDEVEWV